MTLRQVDALDFEGGEAATQWPRYRELLVRRGLARWPGDLAFRGPAGEALTGDGLKGYLGTLRQVRINMEFNGALCRGLQGGALQGGGVRRRRADAGRFHSRPGAGAARGALTAGLAEQRQKKGAGSGARGGPMPKVMIHSAEARRALARGVSQLAAAVEPTLGPEGNERDDRPADRHADGDPRRRVDRQRDRAVRPLREHGRPGGARSLDADQRGRRRRHDDRDRAGERAGAGWGRGEREAGRRPSTSAAASTSRSRASWRRCAHRRGPRRPTGR